MSTDIDYTPRQRAALGATPGICRALNPQRTFMCELDADHDEDGECNDPYGCGATHDDVRAARFALTAALAGALGADEEAHT